MLRKTVDFNSTTFNKFLKLAVGIFLKKNQKSLVINYKIKIRIRRKIKLVDTSVVITRTFAAIIGVRLSTKVASFASSAIITGKCDLIHLPPVVIVMTISIAAPHALE